MIESDYYMWLLDRVNANRGEYSCYRNLLDYLFSHHFRYIFTMDKNRAKSGENLRAIFAMQEGLYLNDVFSGPCTILEMLVAISENLAFDTNEETSYWFWKLIDNLGLITQVDNNYDEYYISSVLDKWMDHRYEPNGDGSIFPMDNFEGDCRTMEIWDQMNAYLMEKYPTGNWID